MGCWLRGRGGRLAGLVRDGKEKTDPVHEVGRDPVFFANLSASQFIHDKDVELVDSDEARELLKAARSKAIDAAEVVFDAGAEPPGPVVVVAVETEEKPKSKRGR